MSTIDRDEFRKRQDYCYELYLRKNKDYGDAYKTHGPIGVIVRLGDKINRAIHISKNNITMIDEESLKDTMLDLSNYAILCSMLLDK